MKRLVALFFGLFSLNALAQIPESIVRSCMLLESSGPDVEYSELDRTGTVSDDEIPGYSLFSYARHDVVFGYATANKGSRDRIVVGAMRVPISRATRLGRDRPPQRIDSSKAVYSILTKAHKNYFCIASNFDGLGRSGSFQNVRQAYIAPLKVAHSGGRMEAVYYGVRDIRNFANKVK